MAPKKQARSHREHIQQVIFVYEVYRLEILVWGPGNAYILDPLGLELELSLNDFLHNILKKSELKKFDSLPCGASNDPNPATIAQELLGTPFENADAIDLSNILVDELDFEEFLKAVVDIVEQTCEQVTNEGQKRPELGNAAKRTLAKITDAMIAIRDYRICTNHYYMRDAFKRAIPTRNVRNVRCERKVLADGSQYKRYRFRHVKKSSSRTTLQPIYRKYNPRKRDDIKKIKKDKTAPNLKSHLNLIITCRELVKRLQTAQEQLES